MSSVDIAREVSMTTMEALNAATQDDFVAAIGFTFEESPWVARAAYARRPFADRAALLAALTAVVAEASRERQVALISAHPDLAGRVAREGRLTPASQAEQTSAGLDALDRADRERFEVLNARYRLKFDFPFVICAREQTKDAILSALATRGANAREIEIATALGEIAKIARLRIAEIVI